MSLNKMHTAWYFWQERASISWQGNNKGCRNLSEEAVGTPVDTLGGVRCLKAPEWSLIPLRAALSVQAEFYCH